MSDTENGMVLRRSVMEILSMDQGWVRNQCGLDRRIGHGYDNVPQQNRHIEWFMHTLMAKAKAVCHLTCLPDSWWEFATAHATHIYNCIPLSCLQ